MLHLKAGFGNILSNCENSHLEFKQTFNLGSGGKYARSMAAFAKNNGGYLVFGVFTTGHFLLDSIESNRYLHFLIQEVI